MLRLVGAMIAARPVLAGGMAGFALLSALVSTNAFYGQPGRHPKPMMATRGEAGRGSLASAPGEGNDERLMPVPLVLEVQTALASTGHYKAVLDGRPGKATAAAIRAFQSQNALRVDGEPSPSLLSQIRLLTAAAPSVAKRPPDAERYASIENSMPAQASANDAGDGPVTATASLPETAGDDAAAGAGADLVRRIQSGLAAADVADLKPDGILGEQTRAAIRTFEALQGLDVTGAPNERVLKRLVKIGALR